MILSRIQLDTSRRSTMKALASPNLLHGAIEQSFPGPRQRNLWRVDKLGEKTYLLILSRELPDFCNLAVQFGVLGTGDAWESKSYDPLLGRVKERDIWNFRLTANPTISKAAEPGQRGKVLGHITVDYQKQWLLERAEKCGFSLTDESFTVVESRWLRFRKGADGGRPVTLLSVTYEGVLTVADADAFCETLVNGMGRGKAYGLGLLTVAGKRRGE